MPAYRVIRVLIYPGEHQAAVAVVARTASEGRNVDRILYRAHVAAPDVSGVSECLRAAADALTDAADRL